MIVVRDLQCRFVIYKKGLESEVDIKNAKENLTMETFVAYNPLAKVPFLVLPNGTVLPESEVRSAPASPHTCSVTRGAYWVRSEWRASARGKPACVRSCDQARTWRSSACLAPQQSALRQSPAVATATSPAAAAGHHDVPGGKV